MTEKISSVFFDYGGTLFEYYPPNAVIWARIAKRLGTIIAASDPRIRQGMRKQSQEFDALGKVFSDLSDEELHKLNCCVLTAMGIDCEGSHDIVQAEFAAREQLMQYQLYPTAVDTLHKIKERGIKIGLLSNVDGRRAALRRPSMEEHGILHFFDAIILSVEVGVCKPNKEIFEIALREIGTQNPAEAMHVGDCMVADVGGARNAGLLPVLFDPLDLHSSDNVIKIQALSEVLKYL